MLAQGDEKLVALFIDSTDECGLDMWCESTGVRTGTHVQFLHARPYSGLMSVNGKDRTVKNRAESGNKMR